MIFPHYAIGKIVKGFGRGSKELGIPTANYSDEVVDKLPDCFNQGVYMGYAQLDNNDGPVYKMVMSIGTNPYYQNHKKTMETHIIHTFDNDKNLYGSILKTVLVGYIRPMKNFSNINELKSAILGDIHYATLNLDNEENKVYETNLKEKIIII